MSKADRVGDAAASPRRRLIRFARVPVAVLGIAFAASQFGELHFMLDNLSNFPVHFAVAFLVFATLLAILRDLRFALAAATGFVISLVQVVPWYFAGAAESPACADRSIKLLVSNVYLPNRQYARLVDLINDEEPDLVGLIEVNSRWLRNLESLRAVFSYRFEVPDEDYAGLALYSKVPLKDARILRFGQWATPAVAATIALPEGDVEFVLAHPPPPMNADFAKRRNAQFRALAQYVASSEHPVVLAGDLNVTMWNRNYRSLAAQSGLKNARAGLGIGPTWPAVGVLGVPIDHILATAPVHLRNFKVLSRVGSDHLPISANFDLCDRNNAHVRTNTPGF